MGEHELLLRHAESWAQVNRRPLDRDLLDTVLGLRSFHDEQRAQEWAPGSVEHLLLTRWPSHGPVKAPDSRTLVETLDTYWKFLRGTGRMAWASADPNVLTKEARRAVALMPAACADPNRYGASKSMMAFGESIGISLDDASSAEEVNERLQEITNRFNDLPFEQRKALTPDDGARGSIPGASATALMQRFMLGGVPERSPDIGDAEPMPRQEATIVALQLRHSPFVEQCFRLAEWVGERREVTGTGMLKLKEARAAHAELDLAAWEEKRRAAGPGDVVLADAWGAGLENLRSAADNWALHRLWLAVTGTGLVAVGRTTARYVRDAAPSGTDFVPFGMMLVLIPLLEHPAPMTQPFLVGVAMHLIDPGPGRPIGEDTLLDWWWGQDDNIWRHLGDQERARRESDAWARRALTEIEDLGLWRRRGGRLVGNELGYEYGLLVASMLDRGLLGER